MTRLRKMLSVVLGAVGVVALGLSIYVVDRVGYESNWRLYFIIGLLCFAVCGAAASSLWSDA